MAVMQRAIQDGGGDHRVTEEVAPLAGRQVAGNEYAATFVTAADELEREVIPAMAATPRRRECAAG